MLYKGQVWKIVQKEPALYWEPASGVHIHMSAFFLEDQIPTFLLQCRPNVDPNIRKVQYADPMSPLWTILGALGVSKILRKYWRTT